jgi:hypothetical protein
MRFDQRLEDNNKAVKRARLVVGCWLLCTTFTMYDKLHKCGKPPHFESANHVATLLTTVESVQASNVERPSTLYIKSRYVSMYLTLGKSRRIYYYFVPQ